LPVRCTSPCFDRRYAGVSLTPVKDTGKDEEPANEELADALLPIIPGEHATAIVAQQIREKLSAPCPGIVKRAAAADHGTFRYADPYSARCPDCDNPTGAAAEARRLLGRWAE
jgi:hypothetical protein